MNHLHKRKRKNAGVRYDYCASSQSVIGKHLVVRRPCEYFSRSTQLSTFKGFELSNSGEDTIDKLSWFDIHILA